MRSSVATLNASAPSPSTLNVSLWDDVATAYRQVCLLRARGLRIEAEQLSESTLASALEAAEQEESGASPDDFHLRRDAIYRIEDERVTQAALMAGLLADFLRDSPSAPSSRTAPQPPAARSSAPPVRPVPADSEEDIITGFIDGMLDHQQPRPPRRGA